MAQGNPLPGEIYLHFKGKQYQVVTLAKDAETLKKCVVYQALYGDSETFVRGYDEFISKVDTDKYPGVKQQYRFQFMENVPDENGSVNEWLLKFLDTDDVEEKYKIVCDIKNDISDRLIDDIAAAMDITILEGDLEDRYSQLKYCMRVKQKYEPNRLR